MGLLPCAAGSQASFSLASGWSPVPVKQGDAYSLNVRGESAILYPSAFTRSATAPCRDRIFPFLYAFHRWRRDLAAEQPGRWVTERTRRIALEGAQL